MANRITAKNKFTGAVKNFSKKIWDNIPEMLRDGKIHPKSGWEQVEVSELSNESKEIIKKATSKTSTKAK